jgi:hypothetical protein
MGVAMRRGFLGALLQYASKRRAASGQCGRNVTPAASSDADTRKGAFGNEPDALAADATAGAAGIAEDRHGKPVGEPANAEQNDEYAQRADGAAAVTGVSGVSGGGRGTTSSGNTRK